MLSSFGCSPCGCLVLERQGLAHGRNLNYGALHGRPSASSPWPIFPPTLLPHARTTLAQPRQRGSRARAQPNNTHACCTERPRPSPTSGPRTRALVLPLPGRKFQLPNRRRRDKEGGRRGRSEGQIRDAPFKDLP